MRKIVVEITCPKGVSSPEALPPITRRPHLELSFSPPYLSRIGNRRTAPRRPPAVTIRRHKSEMSRVAKAIKSAFLCLAVLSLPSCSSAHVGDFIPHAIGGLPADTPPRRGTPEYDAWMAKRAEEAARPKTEQQPK